MNSVRSTIFLRDSRLRDLNMKSIRKMILVVFLVLFSFVNCNDIQNTEDELIFAQVVSYWNDHHIQL